MIAEINDIIHLTQTSNTEEATQSLTNSQAPTLPTLPLKNTQEVSTQPLSQIVDPVRAISLIAKAVELGGNTLSLDQKLKDSVSNALKSTRTNITAAIHGVAYQRKQRMEELYKWRVWTPYPVQTFRPQINGKGKV